MKCLQGAPTGELILSDDSVKIVWLDRIFKEEPPACTEPLVKRLRIDYCDAGPFGGALF